MRTYRAYSQIFIFLGVILLIFIISMGLILLTSPKASGKPQDLVPNAERIVEGSVGNFQQTVIAANGTVIVDFWAPWCGPCKIMSPIVEELANNSTGARLVKINVDDNADLARQYSISAIPTLIFFRGGKEISRSVGVLEREELAKRFQEAEGN